MRSSAVYFALSILAFCTISVYGQATTAAPASNGTIKCHVCMGRDMESCTRGTVKCTGQCYKVVDTKHDLITKGCTLTEAKGPKDKANWQPDPPIFLYWTDNNGTREHVVGHGHFCHDKDKDFCNEARRNSLALVSLFFSFFYIFIASLYR